MSLIKLENVSIERNDTLLLENLNLDVNAGDNIGIIGPNGVGKSSLLSCLNGLNEPADGKIFIKGEEVTAPGYVFDNLKLKIGTIFQRNNLFDHKTVIENLVMVYVSLLKVPKQKAYENAINYLRLVGVAAKADAYPKELSDSEQLRVAITRNLIMDPDIILMDDPTSYLDPVMTDELIAVMKKLVNKSITRIICSSDLDFIQRVCHKVIYLDEHTIYEQGNVDEIFKNPQKAKTKAFILHSREYSYHITSRKYDYVKLMAQIVAFGTKNYWKLELINAVNLIVEELLINSIVPNIEGHVDIYLTINFDRISEIVNISLVYNGDPFNAVEVCDELSAMIIKGKSKKIEYMRKDKNILTIQV